MIEQLRYMKEKTHMTNQQIAEKSGIPESTVARIFSGKTPNPTIITVISIARAMGGSVSDFFVETENSTDSGDSTKQSENSEIAEAGNSDSQDFSSSSEDKTAISTGAKDMSSHAKGTDAHQENLAWTKYYDYIIDMYRGAIRKKDAWIKRLFWTLFIVMFILLIALIFDAVNSSFGYIRYGYGSAIAFRI